jgi:hypothetical protein
MNVMKLIEAEMTLMEGKEMVYASNYPADTVLECCEEAKKRLEDKIAEIKANPQNYVKEGDETNPAKTLGKRYQIEVKLVRLSDEYLLNLV